MSNLLITADDFGLSSNVNRAIYSLVSKHRIGQVSILLTHLKHSDVEDLNKLDIGLGIHLNLTLGKPLLTPELIPTLVNKRGLFYPVHILLIRLFLGKVMFKHVEAELLAQVNKARELGLGLDYFDGHEHIHVFPFIGKRILTFMGSQGFDRTRKGQLTRSWPLRFLILKCFYRRLKKPMSKFRGCGHLSADFAAGADAVKALEKIAQSSMACELMVHPSLKNDNNSYIDQRLEYDFLYSEKFIDHLRTHQISLMERVQ